MGDSSEHIWRISTYCPIFPTPQREAPQRRRSVPATRTKFPYAASSRLSSTLIRESDGYRPRTVEVLTRLAMRRRR